MTETTDNLKAPFPYFGGKSAVAKIVWDALGQPKHYIEPFFGSGAVLLMRPEYDPAVHIETVCDKDGFVCNVWRGLRHDPDEVAKWCDWPVNHADLSARKRRLIANEDRLLENLIADDEWFDAKLAGYWIWAASCWIGSGLTRPGQRPHISNAGKGVNAFTPNIYQWFRRLQERFRRVRVVCGDWTRVCGGDWQDKTGIVGMFFDPPYGISDRDTSVYHHDSVDVAHAVRDWCLKRGDRPTYRIVLAGYDEHENDMLTAGWTVKPWSAQGGYSSTDRNGKSQGQSNRHREMLYFSPHCVASKQLPQVTMEFTI